MPPADHQSEWELPRLRSSFALQVRPPASLVDSWPEYTELNPKANPKYPVSLSFPLLDPADRL